MGTNGQSNLFQLLTMTKLVTYVQKLNVRNRENGKSSEE